MKKWFQSLGYKAQRWMQGRYGNDELSRFLSLSGIVLIILSLIPAFRFLSAPAVVIVIWACIRSYSKNIEKRRRERDAYLRITSKIRRAFALIQKKWTDRKTHRYFKCDQCKTTLRVPKKKGKIKVTCPKCHKESIKKT